MSSPTVETTPLVDQMQAKKSDHLTQIGLMSLRMYTEIANSYDKKCLNQLVDEFGDEKSNDEFEVREAALLHMADWIHKAIKAGEEGIPRQYIECSFDEKDEAKKLGARWDAVAKKWYALGDKTYAKLAKWHPSAPNLPTPPQSVSVRVSPSKRSRASEDEADRDGCSSPTPADRLGE